MTALHPTGATSKRAQSERNLDALVAWLSKAEASGSMADVGAAGPDGFKVNRTHAAKACGFARSAFSTNPAFVAAVSAFEERQNTRCKSSSHGAFSNGMDEDGGGTLLGDDTAHGYPGMASSGDNAQMRKALDAKDKEISNLRRRLHAKSVETEHLRDELRKTRSFLDTVLPTGLPFPRRGKP